MSTFSCSEQTAILQGASNEVEQALDDKDDVFEFVTALLDDTLEQADAAVDAAKHALQRGENPATSKVQSLRQHNYTALHLLLLLNNTVFAVLFFWCRRPSLLCASCLVSIGNPVGW